MIRWTLTLVVCLSLVAVATASLTPHKESFPLGSAARRSPAVAQPMRARGMDAVTVAEFPFNLTVQSEILLDGRPCRYEEVPAYASISLLELAADRHTILRIHFRTRK